MTTTNLQYTPEVYDLELDRVRAIPILPQTASFLLLQTVAMVLVDLSSVVQYNLNLGIVMLQSCDSHMTKHREHIQMYIKWRV